MSNSGYYRFPTIHGETVVFVCEDDLWTVSAQGGIARRLTSNLGEVDSPALSPDGRLLAFTGREEGPPEVFVMPALGGPARRLTFLGSEGRVVGWTPDGVEIIFASSHASPFRETSLYAIAATGGEPRRLPTGPAASLSFGPAGGMVIARHTTDIAFWKRYRGGLAGDIWIDAAGDGQWRRLCAGADRNGDQGAGLRLPGNVARPLWLGERIYFLSDHEGIGSLYSLPAAAPNDATPPLGPVSDRARPQRHASHPEYYLRHIHSDGRRIVYSAGGDLYLYDPAEDAARPMEIQLYSPQVQRNRRFADPARHLQHYALHPEGFAVALTSRGQVFSMANWEGAVSQHGQAAIEVEGAAVAVLHRLAAWLHDGERLALVSDAAGEDALEVHRVDGSEPPRRLAGLELGRPMTLLPSPTGEQVALTNHRHELLLVDLAEEKVRVLDRSPFGSLRGVAWSPDGHWLAYGFPNSQQTSIIRLAEVESGALHDATRAVLRDEEPAWDPEGKYLYFLSARDFDPVYDNLHFDLNFPRGVRPYLLTLQRDLPSPFVPTPRPPGDKKRKKNGGDEDDKAELAPEAAHHASGMPEQVQTSDAAGAGEPEQVQASDAAGGAAGAGTPELIQASDGAEGEGHEEEEERIQIDLDGIAERILAFPVDDARYEQIRGIEGKALFTWWPIEGSLHGDRPPGGTPPAAGVLDVYDFGEQKLDTLIDGLTSFEVSMDAKTLIYRMGNRLRALRAGDKPDGKGGGAPSRQSGWLDLSRLKVAVQPGAEWAQMYRHAWRLQRDQFWSEDMSGVDWQRVYRRYWPLVGRIASRAEFSDLMWEMQGELGTSHAYEMGGDYKPEPDFEQGFLGADFTFDAEAGGYRVAHIVQGDPWDDSASSPLCGPGLEVAEGDLLLAVAGRPLSRELAPQQALVNLAGERVLLTFAGREVGAPSRTVTVKTLRSEYGARYREWVEGKRAAVHAATEGRIGYLHIPNMGAAGYAEFHRGFLAEVTRQGLIVDVRYNGGGHVSQLLLEKLARRRIGYDVQRWGAPESYPVDAVLGPLVALANEWAGSDGDIFSHAFKLMKLGPLVGKRTWGGVIGISPKDALIDGGVTTQPEFSFWFEDVGWGVENYGTDPDIEVEITPEEWIAGRDPQLERAIAEALRRLAENPPTLPDFSNRPRLGLPSLPG